MNADFTPFYAKKYNCDFCDVTYVKQSDWSRHLSTSKHKNRTKLNGTEKKVKESNFICKLCNKKYKARNSLWYHEQKCGNGIGNVVINTIENDTITDTSNNSIVELLIKENTDFKNMIMDLVKNTTDMQKQMIDVYQNIQPGTINSHNNSNNKTFNLQVFLNEECKDAMNLKDFVNSFKLQLSDLELVGDEGFINGMTKVILAKLDGMDANTRPFHCTDLKRETVYVKEDDVWVREGPDNAKLAAAIKAIGHQNFFILKEYKALHPDCESTYSEFNDHYMNLIMKSAGCQKEDIAKVIKKLVKEIVIIK
jgi:hypothetical protein